MDDFSPSDLKTILHSKRANLYYLQHCRMLVNGGRVEYVTDEGSKSRYWNIPIANTTSILLDTGTSITQAAMRELARRIIDWACSVPGLAPLEATRGAWKAADGIRRVLSLVACTKRAQKATLGLV